MIVESLQMCGSAVIRHGATPDMMPLTKKGTPLKGGYHNHPCTRWVGDSRENYTWTVRHALEICKEYTNKYNKIHFCEAGIRHLEKMTYLIPKSNLIELCEPDNLDSELDAYNKLVVKKPTIDSRNQLLLYSKKYTYKKRAKSILNFYFNEA